MNRLHEHHTVQPGIDRFTDETTIEMTFIDVHDIHVDSDQRRAVSVMTSLVVPEA